MKATVDTQRWIGTSNNRVVAGFHFEGSALIHLVRRFISKVDMLGGDEKCWPWQAALHVRGYGRFHVGGRSGRNVLAHRVAFELAKGPLTANACHRCDNPPCCNPVHLFDGTQRENIADASQKGRLATGDFHGLRLHPESRSRGEVHHAARLTEENVIAIRIEACAGKTHKQLAAMFGIQRSTVSEIVAGTKWAHVREKV